MKLKKISFFAFLLATVTAIAVLIVLFFFAWSKFARNTVIKNVMYVNNTEMWYRFNSTDDIKDLRLSFYVFNITNADEVINSKGDVKIQVNETGPFVYDILKTKKFVDNNEKTGLITYKWNIRYILNKNLSDADATKTKVTWPNVPLLVSLNELDKMNLLFRATAYVIFNNAIKNFNESAFITDTVDNFIISGSYRPMFENLQKKLDAFVHPWPFKNNTFALLYGKNNTWVRGIDPVLTVSAGIGGNETYSDLNQLRAINQKPKMSYWKPEPPQCNIVNGTDGQFFAPFINPTSNLWVYVPELCRKIKLQYQQNIYLSGIDSMSFAFDKKNFLSYQKEPENECYCLERDSSGKPLTECSYDGLMDLKTCNQPNIVGSTAHFYGGSPKLYSRIDGLTRPEAKKHLARLLIEPNTGITLKIYTPFQLNVRMRKNSFRNFKFFTDDEPLIVPLAWILETSTMTKQQASILKKQLILLDSWLITTVFGGIIVLIAAIFISTILIIHKCRKQPNIYSEPRETDPLLPTQADRVVENSALATEQTDSSN